METPMNDDSDDGSGGGDGGNIVLNIMTIHIEWIWHLVRKWVYMAHSFVATEPCNICI